MAGYIKSFFDVLLKQYMLGLHYHYKLINKYKVKQAQFKLNGKTLTNNFSGKILAAKIKQ